MKFLYYSIFFGVFLVLLVLCFINISNFNDRGNIRGFFFSELEWFIFLWVMGNIFFCIFLFLNKYFFEKDKFFDIVLFCF